jgi:hypothetical protein
MAAAALLAALPAIEQGAKMAFSAGQMIAGDKNRKQSEALIPSSENVMERQLLNTIRRKRRTSEVGNTGSADRASLRGLGKTYMANAFKAGGPVNMGPLAQLLSQGQQNISSSYGQQANQLLGMEQEQVSKMADVSRDLALFRSANRKVRGAQQEQAGQQNFLASLGSGNFYGQQSQST